MSTCSDVPNIVLAKSVGAPTPTGTLNQYTITYTVTASNSGAAAGSYNLADSFTYAGATVDAVSVVTHGGADPQAAAVLGPLSITGGTIVTGETIAAASSETYSYTVTFTVTNAAQAADCAAPANGLRNTAALGGSATGTAATCTSAPNVALVKTLTAESGAVGAQAEAGEQLTYTITLTNSSTSAATGYAVTDTLDPNVSFVSASNGGAVAGGVVNWNGLTVPANGSLTLTVVVQVANPIANGVTQIANVAYPTGTTPPPCPPAGPQCVLVPVVPPVVIQFPVLQVQKTANVATTHPGGTVIYAVTVSNVGTVAASGTTVGDPLPAGITSATWTCAASGGAACPNASGSGGVNETVATLPASAALVYTITATVGTSAPATITNTASVTPPTGGTCAPAGTAPPCIASVTVTDPPLDPVKVPTLGVWALASLMFALFVAGLRTARPQRRG